jgi:hypothetical protein
MRKLHFIDEFFVLLGPIISRFLHVQMRKKINQNNKGCVLQSYLYDFFGQMGGLTMLPMPVGDGLTKKSADKLLCFWVCDFISTLLKNNVCDSAN